MDDKPAGEQQTEASVDVSAKIAEENAAEVERAKDAPAEPPPEDALAPVNIESEGGEQKQDTSDEQGPAATDEPPTPAGPVTLEGLAADVAALTGRLDLIEQEVRDRLSQIGNDVDGALRRYVSQSLDGDDDVRSIPDRLAALERKLKHS